MLSEEDGFFDTKDYSKFPLNPEMIDQLRNEYLGWKEKELECSRSLSLRLHLRSGHAMTLITFSRSS